MSVNKRSRIGTDALREMFRHLFFAIFPVIFPFSVGFVIGLLFRGRVMDIVSPQEALSNLSGLLSDVLGFLIGFVMLTLGFASSTTIRIILNNPATKFEYLVNTFVPIVYGFILAGVIVGLSGVISGQCILSISMRKLIMFFSSFIAFACSIIKCLTCFFKIISSVVRE